jgi:SNF2 family DNA or RNA helicase
MYMLKPRKKALLQPWKPHKYQIKAVKRLLENQNQGLLLDPGLGKTSITLAAFSMLKEHGTSRGMLVLSPLRVAHLVWPVEAQKWADFHKLKVSVLHGPKMDALLAEDADVYVMNFEGIEWLFGAAKPVKPNVKGLGAEDAENQIHKFDNLLASWKVENARVKVRLAQLYSKVDLLVVDELSKFKHPDTLRFKIVKPHLIKFTRRWGLTGSPAPNGLMDLFGQCYVLDMGNALGPFITHYRANYFDASGYGGYTYVPKEGAEKLIYERLKPLMLRMSAEDYLTLPKLVTNMIEVELDEKSRKVYDTMERDFVAQIEGDVLTAVSSGVASGKCRQIASGAIYLDPVDPLTGIPRTGKREYTVVHDAKIKALVDLLEELQGQPVLIAYEFQHDIERIKKVLRKKDLPVIGSGTSTARTKELVEAWNNNELPYLFGHPASIGHGLNLQDGHCTNVLWFTTTWDYELYDQFVRRVLRQGNKAPSVICHHIVVENSVDEAVMRAIVTKGKNQNALLDALNTYRGRGKKAK